ncbi:Retrovirus-related Pol polyprotein from transposon 412 [Frankliniella fusca]|uniref:RNA-directed DNA polymerase n=1 Tax=Frankliniella fusca TaxID=407009 RepID=A0AAE1H6B4_9NEOP|nr:Retrovirus-related Pol polyprotein from transposon 412 [Frankliniella fusca]KAK3926302.1 Retrovirus-related Pol polyprotein from transposon 412 [Frankliniella fusca]
MKHTKHQGSVGELPHIIAASEIFDCPVTVVEGKDYTYVGQGRQGKEIVLQTTILNHRPHYDLLECRKFPVRSDFSYAMALGDEPVPDTAKVTPTPVNFTSPNSFGFRTMPPPHTQTTSFPAQTGEGAKPHPSQEKQKNTNTREWHTVTHKSKQHNLNSIMQQINFTTPLQNKFQLLNEHCPANKDIKVTCVKKGSEVCTKIKIIPHKQKPKTHKNQKGSGDILRLTDKGIKDQEILTLHSPRWTSKEHDEEGNGDDEHNIVALLPVTIKTAKVEGLLDTGAVVSVMEYALLKRTHPNIEISSTSRSLQAANKNKIKTYGTARVPFKIGKMEFSSVFYICKGISYDIILGNNFLKNAKAVLDYGAMLVTLSQKKERLRFRFGVPFRAIKSTTWDCPFQNLNVAEVYSGPKFVKSKVTIRIPARTIKWVKVAISPHNILQDTLFIGNPHLYRHNKILVSDFILKPGGHHFIQVINTGNSETQISPSQNLAVEDGHEHIFYDTCFPFNATTPVEDKSQTVKEFDFDINPNLDSVQMEKAKRLLEEFRDVFVSDVSELGVCRYPEVKIDYDTTKIVRRRNYRMSPDQEKFIENYIQKLLKSDLIEYCTSVYCTPILCVPKFSPDPARPQWRWVQDFRQINKLLKPIDYPVLSPDQIIDNTFGNKFHSVTDNCSGYSQLPLHPDSRDITAFDTPSGSRMRWKVLAQGLSTAPAIYAVAMDHLLMELKKGHKIMNYFDDTHLGSPTFSEHYVLLEQYLQLLRKFKIKLNIKKSTFFQHSVKLLGVQIDGTEIKILEKRVNAIRGMKAPANKDAVRSLLGVFGYNRRFIKNYVHKVAPLQNLMKDGVEFVWGSDQQRAFDQIKADLSNPPALRIFNPRANNRITCDASRVGLGVCYYQQCPNSKRYHPVAFASRKLKPSEKNLPIYYLECAALVYAFVQFHHYLQNINVETEVWTDHESLKALLGTKNPSGVLAKYVIYLSQYKFVIRYRKGKDNEADTLSRHPVDDPDTTLEELVDRRMADRVQADQLFPMANVQALTRLQSKTQTEELERIADINKAISDKLRVSPGNLESSVDLHTLQNDDKRIREITETLSTGSEVPGYRLINGVLYCSHNGKLLFVVPQNYITHILHEFHDMRGHTNQKYTKLAILSMFYWEKMAKDIGIYCKSCRYCQLHKSDRQKTGLLNPVIAKRPFENIACDFIGPFPLSKNKFQHACVIVDYFTKFMVTIPVRTTDAITAVRCLEFFTLRFGVPASFTSDGASYFNSETFDLALQKFQIKGRHFRRTPHCNGQVEKSIMKLKNNLAQLLLEFQSSWDDYLDLSTFMYNVSFHNTIKTTPFRAVHGYNPVTPGILQLFSGAESDTDINAKLKKHRELIKDLRVRIRTQQNLCKKYYDKNRQFSQFKVGQPVKIRNESDERGFPKKKKIWRGPFKIVGKRSDRFYFVLTRVGSSTGKSTRIVKEYHVRNIRPYFKRPKVLRVQN